MISRSIFCYTVSAPLTKTVKHAASSYRKRSNGMAAIARARTCAFGRRAPGWQDFFDHQNLRAEMVSQGHSSDFANSQLCRPSQGSPGIAVKLATHLDSDIDPEQDLIFFDEVGECQPAVDSLKYFAEKLPRAFICASGSNLGLLDSFPVGKVHWLTLPPLCFEEFVMASGRDRLLAAFRERDRSPVVHDQLWELLLDYYFVGGMPRAVSYWFGAAESHALDPGLQKTHSTLTRVRNDFGVCRRIAPHIDAVFTDIPRELAASRDGFRARYRFGTSLKKPLCRTPGSHRLVGGCPVGPEMPFDFRSAPDAPAATI